MRAALHADSIADFSPLYKGIRKAQQSSSAKKKSSAARHGMRQFEARFVSKARGRTFRRRSRRNSAGRMPRRRAARHAVRPVSRSPASLFLRVPSGRQFLSFPNEKATAASKGTVYLPSAPSASFDDPCGNTVFFHGCLSISPDITKAGEVLLPRPVFLLPRFSVFPDTRSVHRTWHPDRCRERHRPLPTFQNG